ncbi:glycoside hydrolase family 2 protein [Flammeovirga sp. SJP92]|uniref:beta-mannosidase n=1 Tax=Flammeovirga sp. SJP92 TaxID=1775430 RepID=UPI0007878858|nr:glycoside hydrolase family 2 protein [Flammeovirga sp. SJP92]KXX67692.1 hypothetical protein AVL50_24790 [Flammeovirga sp. SJP92]
MKTILFYLVNLLLIAQVALGSNSEIIQLHKGWSFKQVNTTKWHKASVPGTVHSDLINNKIIKDPFYRVNEKAVQWVGEKDWEYKTNFTVSKVTLAKDNISLNFDGLDTYADVYINDILVLEANNMHRGWKVDCKELLREGENTVRVYFHSVFKKDMPKYLNAPFKLQAWPNNDQNSEIWLSLYSRKAGFHFGWDWGPRLITSGIWRPVYLEAWNNFKLEDVQITSEKVSKKQATVKAVYEIIASKAQKGASLEIAHKGKVYGTKTFDLKEGQNLIPVTFNIKNPKLWWSKGLGDPHLYTFDCTVKSASKSVTQKVRTGIRSIRVIKEEDAIGKSMTVELNGVKVFMKGANYIPLHNLQDQVTEEKYRYYIQQAVDANMNMLRVWGGGIYEEDIFYDLCDENGLLVWQDIMFACGMFPADQDYLQSVTEEVKYNVKRLRNHPSIALWNGNNENEISWHEWGWKHKYTDEEQKIYIGNLKKLFYNVIPDAIATMDQTRHYHPTSPNTGYNNISENYGDVHLWHTKGDTPLTVYDEVVGRFMSEYGFQSYPEMKTIKKFTQKWERNKTSEVMFAHNRAKQDQTRDPNFGNQAIERKMETYYGIPKDFETYVYRSQILHAKATKIAIEAHRRNMPKCMGTLYWQLNDCWPAISWSTIDYYGNWKAPHYTVRDVYQEVIAPVIIEDGKLNIYLVSDRLKDIKGELVVTLMKHDGTVLNDQKLNVLVEKNNSKIYFGADAEKFLNRAQKNDVVLQVQLLENDKVITENHFDFVVEKEMNLKADVVKSSAKNMNGTITITLSASSYAKNVFLSYKEAEGHFSNNYLDLLPNQEVEITFTPKEGSTPKDLIIRSYADFNNDNILNQ